MPVCRRRPGDRKRRCRLFLRRSDVYCPRSSTLAFVLRTSVDRVFCCRRSVTSSSLPSRVSSSVIFKSSATSPNATKLFPSDTFPGRPILRVWLARIRRPDPNYRLPLPPYNPCHLCTYKESFSPSIPTSIHPPTPQQLRPRNAFPLSRPNRGLVASRRAGSHRLLLPAAGTTVSRD